MSDSKKLTTTAGSPVPDNQNALTAGQGASGSHLLRIINGS